MMRRTEKTTVLAITITAALLLGSFSALHTDVALADPGRLIWSIVVTPAAGQPGNIIVSPSEINTYVTATDGTTFYAVDIANADNTTGRKALYKSTDGGITWPVEQELGPNLITAGAILPVWNIAVAPDDPKFVVAVTDNNTATNGPRNVFLSDDGGTTWHNTNFPPTFAGFIGCIDISMKYSTNGRDIAVGTRTGGGTGTVWVLKLDNFAAGWVDQLLVPTGDVVASKFSPNYTSDFTLVVVYADAIIGGTFLTTGSHDVVNNTTVWSGTQVNIRQAGNSPNASQIATADLELPSDFLGTDPTKRRYYISYDDVKVTGQDGIYRIDDTMPYRINPPTIARFSSIAYWGTYEEGKLAAGEVTTPAGQTMVNVWRCSDSMQTTPTWSKSDDQKSPTGGANSGFANAKLTWSLAGDRLYCSTSSENITIGGTNWVASQWPRALLNSVALDESAFSVSPYSQPYEQDLTNAGIALDKDVGKIWNQVSLIDTEITFLSDVAALDVPEDSTEYPLRYLATVSNNATVAQNCNSVWRTTSDDLGRTWERILCVSSNATSLLRVNPRGDTAAGSRCLAFAREATTDVRYSTDEGQSWQLLYPGITVTDLSLASDTSMYVLSGAYVRRGETTGTNCGMYRQTPSSTQATP
jgi:hypothetical protein